ncbi:MAG: glycosyltransferase family 2 protein [Candidatus Omnitrophica bacterium]|nr:glycosyltransferase family 2 protein [Candidatus Omnitrophota bacterium]
MKISVVIRSKNEGPWLRRCLTALAHQESKPCEVILVDNESTDQSVSVARKFGCRVLQILDPEFTYGRALNRGIDQARGEGVICLSAHCIPVHNRWLEALGSPLAHPQVAAVYGRQEPLPDSHDFDKRDLWTTFGIERRIQRKDFFFHNANSMIRKSVWKGLPFDEALSGVEDRDWAKRVISHGHWIAYEPLASVHHFHGIHQGRDEGRARRVVRVIELIHRRRLEEVRPK